MKRLVLIGVELVDGKPDLQLPPSGPPDPEFPSHEITKLDANHFVVRWDDHDLALYKLGRLGGLLYFLGVGDKAILAGLAHLGAKVKLARTLSSTVRDQILATGIKPIRRVSDNAIVGIHPPVTFAGDVPISVGLDGELEEGEEYTVG